MPVALHDRLYSSSLLMEDAASFPISDEGHWQCYSVDPHPSIHPDVPGVRKVLS